MSIKKTLPAAVFACLALATAHAQDPLKTEAKHYSLAFENETVQVLNVHYGPHEKSGMHDHPGGVVVILTGGHLRFTDQTGKSHDVFAKPGESRWFPPLKHSVEKPGRYPLQLDLYRDEGQVKRGEGDCGTRRSGVGRRNQGTGCPSPGFDEAVALADAGPGSSIPYGFPTESSAGIGATFAGFVSK